MPRFYLVVTAFALVFTIYTFVDVVLTDKSRVKTLPKQAWVVICVLPVIGGLLWLAFGKARDRSQSRGAAYDTAPGGAVPAYSEQKARKIAESDAVIADLERRLAALDAEAAAQEALQMQKQDAADGVNVGQDGTDADSVNADGVNADGVNADGVNVDGVNVDAADAGQNTADAGQQPTHQASAKPEAATKPASAKQPPQSRPDSAA